MLQEWTWGKRVERWFKIIAQGADPDGLSAAPPDVYKERFQVTQEKLICLIHMSCCFPFFFYTYCFQRKVRDILGTADVQHSQADDPLCMSY